MSLRKFFFTFVSLCCTGLLAFGETNTKPIRALLVTGGCCHDYAHQKTILTEGISARANVVWSIVHEGDGTTDHKISIYDDPDWAKNFDVVVHDECCADVKDAAFVRGILKPHRNGLPAVNLHCAMHCYRVDFDHFKEWFEFTGLDTRAHGAQLPIALSSSKNQHPILTGFTNWTTVPEELYNNIQIWPTITPLLYGQQGNDSNVVAWVNDYHGTRVFSTTLGHNNSTVSDPRYLDLVTRGLLWSVGKLNAEYLKPAATTQRKAQKTVRVPINLALHKKASASASQDGHAPGDAVDGDSETRWCAPDNGSNYWWQVDLGKPQDLTGTRIVWEKPDTAYKYRIQGSTDAVHWQLLAKSKGKIRAQVDELGFSAQGIRYVRITVTQAPPGSWASFFEFAVLGKEFVDQPVSTSDPRLASVQSPAGFEQSLFAAPPNISYPTCLDATPWGDVFVGVDQNGSLDREKNRGWVVRCRDTDGDGVADEFKTFAKMDSPRGIVFDHNTLYVMHPPVLEAFYDDNGDGVADRSEVLVRGLGRDLDYRGADHTCNGVRLGIDGWLYIALGDYGALNAVAKDGTHIQVHGGGIVRVRPDGSDLEVVVQGTRNIYDVAIDPLMNIFTCDNTNDGDEWNVRLSHMIATANYGYPSLFKHFSDEIMPTMQDFGGGSPTGALFLDEPSFPDEFGHGLYTCQWGWNNVSRHPLKSFGATFNAEKETFVRIPRPTGIAADGCGNLYVASWNGATFTYAGPNVGYIVRVSPLNNKASFLPAPQKLSEKELLHLLGSPSATQRLHVQREILRRKPSKAIIAGLVDLALSRTNLSERAAAVFTLEQINEPTATQALFKLKNDAILRPLALKALADAKSAPKLPSKVFINALQDKNPSVRLQAIIALNRLHRTETANDIFPLLADNDHAVAHVAFRALAALEADSPCFKAIDQHDSALAAPALRVLSNIHQQRVVDGLLQRFQSTDSNRLRVLETICRLYHREADWDGSWWTTRPDTSGPYYKPVSWEGTEKIAARLREEVAANDPTTIRALMSLFQKYKIESPEIPLSALSSMASDSTADTSQRKQAFETIALRSDEAAVRTILACNASDAVRTQLRDHFVHDARRAQNVDLFANMASSSNDAQNELAFAVLLQIAGNPNVPASARAHAQSAIDTNANSPSLERAKASTRIDLKPAHAQPTKGVTIAKLAYEEVVQRASAAVGDAKVGAQLFQSVGCVKCHTVSKTEPPKGPFLGDIATRYNKLEIMESILRPNAQIAQGFETTSIETKDGDSLDGFIVRESGDEIELRNITGAIVIQKKNIAQRGTRKTSIMPEGLADGLTPEELGSLLRYLQSLSKPN